MTALSQMISRIDDKASSLEVRRVLIAIITMPFYLIGLILGLILRMVWVTGVYLYSAAVVGFEVGFGRKQ